MKQKLEMLGRPIDFELSKTAAKQLEKIDKPLCLEMELYFSCMIRKQVSMYDEITSPFSVEVSDKLKIGFRPVMTKSCSVSSCEGSSPPVTDFPIKKPECYIPHWLKLDFKKGKFMGEFGYTGSI